MEYENKSALPSVSALERARIVSKALSDAARRARFSSRSRRAYASGGFQARSGQAAFRIFLFVSFWLMVAIPSIVVGVYYLVIASDQFVAEAQFTVQGGDVPVIDAIGKISGLPALAIVQDTQIVANYIQSRAAVEQLEKDVSLRRLYSVPEADFWARFDEKKPIEKFVKYWENMSDVSIKMPSGILVFKVRAFSPGDALKIAQATLQICERLINEMNDRMHHDAVNYAEKELERMSVRLKNSRVALEMARNDQGIMDAGKASDGLEKLILEARSYQLKLQQEYTSHKSTVSSNAPQMIALKAQLDAIEQQINELKSNLTKTKMSSSGETILSSSMTKFAELDIESKIAQKLYTSAAASLSLARLTAEHKVMYLNIFVKPAEAQESLYPRRNLYTSLFLLAALSVWGILIGLISLIRNHMA